MTRADIPIASDKMNSARCYSPIRSCRWPVSNRHWSDWIASGRWGALARYGPEDQTSDWRILHRHR